MIYQWNDDVSGISEERADWEIEILSLQEFQAAYPAYYRRIFLANELSYLKFCKAERLKEAVLGTYAMPAYLENGRRQLDFGYCILQDKIIFVDDYDAIKKVLDEMQEHRPMGEVSTTRFSFDFMDFLLKDDMIFLQQYEEKLSHLEEALLDNEAKNFEQKILMFRKALSSLSAYYEQLTDIGDALQKGAAESEDDKTGALFGLYTEKVRRLYDTVSMLKEYSVQLRELRQTQIGVRQNKIMQFLTVITAVFLPLNLVTGWYGMNFSNMPELNSPHGYAVLCVICLGIIGLELFFLKKYKWLQ